NYPTKLVNFRSAATHRDRDAIKRGIKYIKTWAALKWPAEKYRPNSTALTILVVSLCPDGMLDDDAFATTIENCREYFDKKQTVPNPTGDHRDVLQLDEAQFNNFREKLADCANACNEAIQLSDPSMAAIRWGEVFEHLFPPMREHVPAVDHVGHLPAIYLRPMLSASVYTRGPSKLLLGRHTDDFTVLKNCDIIFSVTNPEDIPFDATVKWVVRNQGQEAEMVNDLGHLKSGPRKLEQTEQAKYAGDQYMDCIVTQNGSFLGMNSIKVSIIDREFQKPRNRPWYARFR
ncbi:MAG: hypothetical protein LUO93_09340, partial [Methanomicrobiales archaeon]|nr:hypothetical protein [Methanomicrobiales archaeon]